MFATPTELHGAAINKRRSQLAIGGAQEEGKVLMRLHLLASCVGLLSLELAGCTTNGAEQAAATSPADVGTVVSQADMPGFCQNAAAAKYGASLANIDTNDAIQRNGGTEIEGTVGGVPRGTQLFNCRFDSNGAFLGVMDGLSAS